MSSIQLLLPARLLAEQSAGESSSAQLITGQRHHQFAMLDPLNADKFVGNMLDIPDTPPDDKHLQAVVGIKMNMQSGNDLVMVGMLLLSQLFRKIAHMVIIDQGYRADRFLLLRPETFLHQ